MKPEKAVVRETLRMMAGVGIMCVVMLLVFLLIGRMTGGVLIGAAAGFVAAVGNFFLMAMNVQRVTAELKPDDADDLKHAKTRMKASYNMRLVLMGVFLVAAIKLLDAYWVTALLPLLFPRIVIMAIQIFQKRKSKGSEY